MAEMREREAKETESEGIGGVGERKIYLRKNCIDLTWSGILILRFIPQKINYL